MWRDVWGGDEGSLERGPGCGAKGVCVLRVGRSVDGPCGGACRGKGFLGRGEVNGCGLLLVCSELINAEW